MSEHDRIVRLLSLGGTEAVGADEIRLVQEHLKTCVECRRANEDYAVLGSTLRSLPTPQPSAELLARVRLMAAPVLAQQQARNREAVVLAPLVAASWVTALITWPWLRTAGTWLLAGWRSPDGSFAQALAAYSILGFLLASVAVIVVGRRAGTIGRTQ